MKDSHPKRTQRMLLHHLVEQLGGQPMKNEFIRLFDHTLDPVAADKEMTEAEYQFYLQKIREELPAYKRYLLSISAQSEDSLWFGRN